MEPLIFELQSRGSDLFNRDTSFNKKTEQLIPKEFLNKEKLPLPEISEVDLVRHFTHLAHFNYSVDGGFYPLGSCTMKYNPKINEEIASFSGFSQVHPYTDEKLVQGILQLLYELAQCLCEIAGMDRITFQPAAGAHGETTGLLLIKAYHQKYHPEEIRNIILVPDTSHGTNPASAALAGYQVLQIKSNPQGDIDFEELKKKMTKQVAALMLTNPNTLGLFEKEILEITDIVHQSGALLYGDGANLNALLGLVRPGDLGFDVIHFNLHKTFATPHGSGGPGAGPVGVKKQLGQFLPVPLVEKNKKGYFLNYNCPESIGKVKSLYGNFLVAVKAYTYIRNLGPEGLRRVSEQAILNANYLLHKIKDYYNIPYKRSCMHEFVVSPQEGISTLDVAKRLMDYGFHPPTIYFPLIVPEALMIEPTETESKKTLDAFSQSLIDITREAKENYALLKEAPHTTVVGRLDEVQAARQPVLRYK